MRRNSPLSALCLGIFLMLASRAQAQVQVYIPPPAADVPRSTDFTKVEVKASSDSTYTEIPAFRHQAAEAGDSAFCAFGLNGTGNIRVTFKDNITSAVVRPSRKGITPTFVSGTKVVTFSINNPQNIILEVNGQIDHPLAIFANPRETVDNKPSPSDSTWDYYSTGTVTTFRNNGRSKIYIEGGALVKCPPDQKIFLNEMEVRGYGMVLQQSNTNLFASWNSNNVKISGIIVNNIGATLYGQDNWTYLAHHTSNISIDNVKFFNDFYGQDAIDLNRCTTVTINNCFFKSMDDCVALKASDFTDSGTEYGATKNVTVSNCVFWQDTFGSPLHISETYTAPNSAGTFSNINFTNNDVVRFRNYKDANDIVTYIITFDLDQGGIIDGVKIEDLYVENSDRPALFGMNITNRTPNNNRGMGNIQNVTFKNVRFTDPSNKMGLSVANGYDSSHKVQNITLDGIYRNGTMLTQASQLYTANAYTANITFLLGTALANGSFETPSTSNYSYNATGGTWSFTGNSGVQRNGSGFSGTQNAPEGVQTAFLQGQNGSNGFISQSLNFAAGTYTVSFKAAKRSNYGGSQSFDVFYDTTNIGTFTPTSGTFTSFTSNSFPATAGSHTIKFQGTSTSGDNTAFIDDIKLNSAVSTAKLTGTTIGTTGSWSGTSGDDKSRVFDGSFSTAFDASVSQGWVGLDLGSSKTLTLVKYAPRSAWASRMNGGKIQGSTTADFSSGVTELFPINTNPPEGTLTSQTISGSYRYVRYLSPDGGFGNISELEFWGN